jgi:hypothetical protein
MRAAVTGASGSNNTLQQHQQTGDQQKDEESDTPTLSKIANTSTEMSEIKKYEITEVCRPAFVVVASSRWRQRGT